MRCIDEVSDNTLSNAAHFPLDEFLDEAGRRVVRMVPLSALGSGRPLSGVRITDNGDGSGNIELPRDFCRLISLRMAGWQRPVTVPITTDNPDYRKQFNPVLRGGKAKPVAVLVNGDTELEYFSIDKGVSHKIEVGRYFGFLCVDNNYPAKLIDITAWQLAELVFSTMYDTTGATTAKNKVTELIGLL